MSNRGLIAPENPVTGIVDLASAIQFDVLTRVSGRQMSRPGAERAYEISVKPSTEHRTETLDHADLEGWYSDEGEMAEGPTLENPLQIGIGLKDRSIRMAADLEAAFKSWDLVSISCPGLAVRSWIIESCNCEPQALEAAVRVTLSVKEQRVVELEERTAIADADVEALGAGGLFDAGEL